MNKIIVLVIVLLLAAIPARAESIQQCIGEPVRYVQVVGELPVCGRLQPRARRVTSLARIMCSLMGRMSHD